MTNHVAFYARSSNDAHDVSCDSQLREFQALADEAGEVVVETRVDKAVKHSEAQGFIELVRLATAASPPPFSKVYVYDTARISRDHVRQAVLRRKMIDAGVEVYFVKVPKTNTWIDELVISVLSILDQVHAEKSRQDARRGQRENILRGWRAGGPAPYGYQLVHEKQGTNRRGDPIVKSLLEPKPEEAEIVKEVFERFGAGESMRIIAEDLSRRRVPRKRGGCRWTNSSITEMLNKVDTYLGTAVWGAVHHARYRRGKQPRVRPREKWTIVEDAHPAIITKELAESVKSRRRKKGRAPRKGQPNPLHGLLTCGKCGGRVHGWGRGRLRCANAVRGGECTLPSLSTKGMVRAVLGALKEATGEQSQQEVAERLVELSAEGSEERRIEESVVELGRRIAKWEAGLAEVDSPAEIEERIRGIQSGANWAVGQFE